jgi:hypothetical protein
MMNHYTMQRRKAQATLAMIENIVCEGGDARLELPAYRKIKGHFYGEQAKNLKEIETCVATIGKLDAKYDATDDAETASVCDEIAEHEDRLEKLLEQFRSRFRRFLQ